MVVREALLPIHSQDSFVCELSSPTPQLVWNLLAFLVLLFPSHNPLLSKFHPWLHVPQGCP